MKNNLLLALTFIWGSAFAQVTNPEFGDAFLQDEVASVRVNLSDDDLDYILDSQNWGNSVEVPATFIYESSELTDTVEDIGFRLRGNTSLAAGKKSFKVSFTEFSSGRRWQGLKKLNLNGEHNDVSIMRSRLSWDLLREAGMSASRTSYVRLFINDEFKGVYLNVEHIDDEYVSSRYTEGNGNLYKCTWPADLNYQGNDPNDYQTSAYELKTNEWWDVTHGDLANFVTLLNQTSTEELGCKLPQAFNVREYIKNLAMEVLIGHWDGYSVNKNNYYLYNNLAEQRIEFLEYDLDNTLGIDWFGIDWSTRNIYNWSNGDEDRPLYEVIMEDPAWRNIFSYEINRLIENHFNSDNISSKLTTWKNLIGPFVQDDDYYTYDYGFNYNDFLDSDTDNWGNHVSQGILEYVDNRVSSALNQLEEFASPQGIFYVDEVYPIWGENNIGIYFLTDESASPNAVLSYTIDNGSQLSASFEDYSDGWFYTEISFTDDNYELSYQIDFTDNDFNIIYPCEFKTIPLNESNSSLVINEAMPDNETVISDSTGDFEDWLELYNSGNSPITLGSYYLTDNLEFPNKWKLSNTVLSSDDHYLVWCDDDPEESNIHTNFQLNNQGESLYIFENYEDGFRAVDWISIPELGDDESYGRETDGNSLWIIFTESTPNAPNGIVHLNELNSKLFNIYPNPTTDIVLFNKIASFELKDTNGLTLKSGHSNQLDMSDLSSAVYLLSIENITIRVIKL